MNLINPATIMILQASPFPSGMWLVIHTGKQAAHCHYSTTYSASIRITSELQYLLLSVMQKSAPKKKKLKPSFTVPEGFYRAVFAEAVLLPPDYWREKSEEKIRLLFDLPELTKGTQTYRAGNDYAIDLSEDSPLNQVANVLLDRNLTDKDFEGDQCVLCEAIGQEVGLRIVHFKGKGYKVPYSKIDCIMPVGTWDMDEDEMAVVDRTLNV